jgi:hypothetical protein
MWFNCNLFMLGRCSPKMPFFMKGLHQGWEMWLVGYLMTLHGQCDILCVCVCVCQLGEDIHPSIVGCASLAKFCAFVDVAGHPDVPAAALVAQPVLII